MSFKADLMPRQCRAVYNTMTRLVLRLDDPKVNSRLTLVTLQITLRGMFACIYVIDIALPDDHSAEWTVSLK